MGMNFQNMLSNTGDQLKLIEGVYTQIEEQDSYIESVNVEHSRAVSYDETIETVVIRVSRRIPGVLY